MGKVKRASQLEVQNRITQVIELMQIGTPSKDIVAKLMLNCGISDRQAKNYIASAYEVLADTDNDREAIKALMQSSLFRMMHEVYTDSEIKPKDKHQLVQGYWDRIAKINALYVNKTHIGGADGGEIFPVIERVATFKESDAYQAEKYE